MVLQVADLESQREEAVGMLAGYQGSIAQLQVGLRNALKLQGWRPVMVLRSGKGWGCCCCQGEARGCGLFYRG